MVHRRSEIARIRQLTVRFAPLLRIFENDFEVDWEFYSKAGREYQDLMNLILLALGVFTINKDGNFCIQPVEKTILENFMPEAGPWKFLHFHFSRREDANRFLENAPEIYRNRGVTIPPKGLMIVRDVIKVYHLPDPLQEGRFDPNEVRAPIIITGRNMHFSELAKVG